MSETIFLWLLTYALHSTALLGAVLLAERTRLLPTRQTCEWAWRLALFGALATSLLQVNWSTPAPAALADSSRPAAALVPVPSNRSLQPATQGATSTGRVTEPTPSAVGRANRGALATPRAAATIRVPAALPVRSVALGWSALAAAGVLLTLARLLWLRRQFSALPPCADARTLDSVDRLARRAGIAQPAVCVSSAAGSPLVVPMARLCVPTWTLNELEPRQREAMLAHEIAHVLRRDPLWRLAAELACSALFFQPLNRIAARRLEALAELACDEWAARHGEGRALAECLVVCAEHVGTAAPRLATAMAGRRSPLLERIESLLKESPMPRPVRTLIARVALAAALPCALLLPVVAIERAVASEGHSSIQMSDSFFGRHMSVDITLDGARIKSKIKGDVRFSANEDDVESLSDSAWIEETRAGVTRRIEFASSKGAVERKYSVDGREQALDADGKRWLAAVVPALMRETAYDAKPRVARLQARGGVDAVLAEIALIKSDYARRNYVATLSETARLNDAQVTRLLALCAATRSDFERRESLTSVVEQQVLNAENQVALLDLTASMGSDFEQRQVLTALAPKLAGEGAVTAAWVKVVVAIESDFEARESIGALAERDALSREQLEAAIGAAAGIGSDFEARTALSSLAPHVAKVPQAGIAYAKATHAIGSDFERREALNALVGSAKLDVEAYYAVLDATAGIGSDFECRTALLEIAAHMPADAGLIKRYREIARGLGDYERGQAEKALDRFAAL